MTILDFRVTGMTCAHCQRAVTDAIVARDAAARIEITLATGLVHVETRLSRDAVADAIAAEGYAVLP